ncbi:hypothetical protein F5Y15DRAFT_414089 [Xylariaceae sp. FL0016]|nr:hypothetical protein F5Y15DRAFT_414089 [Xylariaceae sp. FL0016]
MLSLASLLNPAPPGAPINRFPPSPASSSPTNSFTDESSFLDRPMMPKHKMPKDATVFTTKSRPKGVVNFPPFERLDEASLRQVRKFQVYPLGKIQEYCRHIPYNSGKKDFYEKTGRESFEVFQYVFRVPGDDTEYAVMWDYNVGLVRMTPFFKCCKYPKTTPAKMLNSNPGLKEITHSITGGSIMAQGYWMPYQCAKAVCATFCHNIAGALIPIFGPDFPSHCTPAEAPEYSRMIIDPAIVIQSTREADRFRRIYKNMTPMPSTNGSGSPKRNRHAFRSPYDDAQHQPRHRVRKAYVTTGCDSPYVTDTDGDISPATTDGGSIGRDHSGRILYSPLPSAGSLRPNTSGWTPANISVPPPPRHSVSQARYDNPGPSPWLSAIPRFTTTAHLPPPYPTSSSQSRAPPQPQIDRYHPPPPPHPSALSSHSHTKPHQHHHQHYHQLEHAYARPWPAKRSASSLDSDHEHEGNICTRYQNQHQSRAAGSRAANKPTASTVHSKDGGSGNSNGRRAINFVGADKKAALLLMNLSVRDTLSAGLGQAPGNSKGKGKAVDNRISGEDPRGGREYGSGGSSAGNSLDPSPHDKTFPRIKRVRSNSM